MGQGARGGQAARSTAPAAPFKVDSFSDETFLRFPLASADQMYAAIDGRTLKQHVVDLTAISQRYRDAGHQFWGRIIGTDADHWNAEWMMLKLQAAGATNVRKQEIPLPPQWMPRGWDVTGASAGKSVPLTSAWPSYSTPATPPGWSRSRSGVSRLGHRG